MDPHMKRHVIFRLHYTFSHTHNHTQKENFILIPYKNQTQIFKSECSIIRPSLNIDSHSCDHSPGKALEWGVIDVRLLLSSYLDFEVLSASWKKGNKGHYV
jgi:hypothetical protein